MGLPEALAPEARLVEEAKPVAVHTIQCGGVMAGVGLVGAAV